MFDTINVHYNPNPLQKKAGDCVVRAMCKATGKDWDTVYYELCLLGSELKAMPNDKEVWKAYLKRNNFIEHKVSNARGSKRPTVQSFSLQHNKGTYVLNLANHIVTVQDGYFYDTWDCGKKSLYGYYEKT